MNLNKNIYFKLYCNNNIVLYFNEQVINANDLNYNLFTTETQLTNNELMIISDYYNKQYNKKWFNDQNLFVENEYNRIKKLTTKQEIKKDNFFDSSILKVHTGSINATEDLNNIIGLSKIKKEVDKLKSILELKKKQDKFYIDESMHMCFYGNPGTGKTTVARIIAGILYELGYIKENKCVEINALELKGSNVGQTSLITKNIIDFAKGGVLFVDEAYTLYDNSNNNFGKEAVNLFLKEMEDNRDNLVVIFAGYYEPMQKLLNSNIGFRSRIKKHFFFEDYTANELFDILMLNLKNKHFYINEDAMKEIFLNFKNIKKIKNFGNGRYVHNVLTKIIEAHVINSDVENNNKDTITLDDVKEGCDLFEL